jgi:hypothetical protein
MIKVDGTNSKLIFLAGTANTTTLTSSLTATPWTLTLPPNAGTAGQVLTTDGNGVLSWSAGGGSANIPVADTTLAANEFPLFVSATGGNLTQVFTASNEYTFNPGTGQLNAKNVNSTAGIHLNGQIISSNYTIPAGTNGLSAGPMTVNAGVTVTVGAGQAWKVV